MIDLNKLITRKEAAEILGLKPNTLAVWATEKRNLPYYKIGSSVKYKLSDIEQFIFKNKNESK
jgi:excisionase family DNA binding protein